MRCLIFDFSAIKTVFFFETKRFFRRKRLIAMLIIEAIIILLPPLVRWLVGFSPTENIKDFVASELNFWDLITILTATFFAADSLSSEFEKRTGYVLFPNPVRRLNIYVGKFASSYVFSAVFVLVYYLYVVGEALYYFGEVPGEIYVSLFFALVYLLAVISLAFFFSSLLNSSVFSILLVFFTLFLIMPIIVNIHSLIGVEPWYILTYHANTATLLFNPPKERIQKLEIQNITIWIFRPEPFTSFVVSIVYAIVCLVISYLTFSRKELKG